MIPKELRDWNYGVILKLLKQGYYESELFDFKEMLPQKNDERGKNRLVKICCAFANHDGGFLVFGIKDDKLTVPEKRIIGIDKSIDFPEQFGNYPRRLTPAIQWDFLNPPIKLDDGRLIHVIEIKPNLLKPVGYEESEKGWFFSKRTNKGDELMSYEEIKLNFMNFYEKKIKLQLLLSELESIKINCSSLIFTEDQMSTHYSLVKFNLSVIETILSDTFTILYTETELMIALNKLRNKCEIVNRSIEIFHSKLVLPRTDLNEILKDHNGFINIDVPKVLVLATKCSDLLIKFIKNN
ncbi:MAG: ATP-binding protein [Cyclobacteriaceae bacterium]|jgi:hypothetical protein|nr:ATP-binding protein [Cyclobacteriaceae bacterium]